MVGSLTKAFGFTYSEVNRFTLGQVVRYMKAMPEIMPLINPFAKPPEKALTGKDAIGALKLLGVQEAKTDG